MIQTGQQDDVSERRTSADPGLAAPVKAQATPAARTDGTPTPVVQEHVVTQSRKNTDTGNWGLSTEKLAQLDADLSLGRVVILLLRDCMGEDLYRADYGKIKDVLIRRDYPELFWLLKVDDLYAAGHPGVTKCS